MDIDGGDTVKQVKLDGYKASVPGARVLQLGTYGSYGIEKIQVVPGDGWEDMTIAATFVTPSKSVRVVVPLDFVIDVPPEATAVALTSSNAGKIVFVGVKDGVQRVTSDIRFLVSDHAKI